MYQHVSIQVALHSESLVTQLTLEVFLSAVHNHVAIKVTLHSESLVAQLTLKPFNLAVPNNVIVEVALLRKPLAALLTLIWLLISLQPKANLCCYLCISWLHLLLLLLLLGYLWHGL